MLALVALAAAALGARWAARDRFSVRHTAAVFSRVDGARYRVHGAGPEAAAASDTLATLNGRAVAVLRRLRDTYVRGAAGTFRQRRAAARLLARYDPDSLAENSPRDPSGDTSYTINKGELIALCLRERAEGAPLHDIDVLTFVALHEMAHLATDAVDHPAEFWATFRFLLEEAEAAGVYTSPDFAARPRAYCGLSINYNPRWDN